MITDNCAERLLKILVEGKAIAANVNCRNAWKQILEVDDQKESFLLSRLSKAMMLPDLTVESLKNIDGSDHSFYQHWYSAVTTGFKKQNLNDNWGTFINNIDDHSISYLKINASLLQAHVSNSNISEEKLDEIHQKIQETLDDVLGSDLSEVVKIYLINSLQNILNAIREYKITGFSPIMEAIESSFGHAVINSEFREEMKNSETGKKVWDALGAVATIVSLATGLPQIASAAMNLLQ